MVRNEMHNLQTRLVQFKGALSGLRQFLATESPLKMISPQKLFSFSRYLSFCLDFWDTYQNGLIQKIRLIL